MQLHRLGRKAESSDWSSVDLIDAPLVAPGLDVNRYMPAYRAYLPALYRSGPSTARAGHVLIAEIDESRTAIENQPGLKI
jgi:hypothetical protein